MTYMDDFTKLIYHTRLTLGESQTVFGKRFQVSHASVSMWENGETEAPYKVLYFCLHQPLSNTTKRLWTANELYSAFSHFRDVDKEGNFYAFMAWLTSQSTMDTQSSPTEVPELLEDEDFWQVFDQDTFRHHYSLNYQGKEKLIRIVNKLFQKGNND